MREVPFDSERKRRPSLWKEGRTSVLVSAPDIILRRCSCVRIGIKSSLKPTASQNISAQLEGMTAQAYGFGLR